MYQLGYPSHTTPLLAFPCATQSPLHFVQPQKKPAVHSYIASVVFYLIKSTVNTLSYRTLSGNTETADKKWFVVDAEGQTVGRLASKVAKVIRGKYKTCYTPHADCGDNVIVINAEKVSFSGTKLENKEYVRFSGYPGGQRFTSAEDMLKKHPERLIEKAIKGMLPKNRLGRELFHNLFVYAGPSHPHAAQQPKEIKF